MSDLKNNNYSFVYLTINKINGMCYIGSHTTYNLSDSYLGSGKYLVSAIKKYNKTNFIKIIIKQYNSILEARQAEELYIQKFDTLVPNGYNISPTGRVVGVRMLSDESKYKCGSTNRGKKTWMSNNKHTKESKELNRQKHLGKKDSIETKQRKSQATKGENNAMFGKSYYTVWVEKYGIDIANEKLEKFKNKISSSNTGKSYKHKGKTLFELWKEKYGEKEAIIRKNINFKKHSESFKGKHNNFNMYDNWVEKFGKHIADEKFINYKNNMSRSLSGNKNPMYGKSAYSIWVEKYGIEIAEKKKKESNLKRINNTKLNKLAKIN